MVCGLRTHRPVWGCFPFLLIAFPLVFFFSMFFFIQGLEFNFDPLLMQLQVFPSEIRFDDSLAVLDMYAYSLVQQSLRDV